MECYEFFSESGKVFLLVGIIFFYHLHFQKKCWNYFTGTTCAERLRNTFIEVIISIDIIANIRRIRAIFIFELRLIDLKTENKNSRIIIT